MSKIILSQAIQSQLTTKAVAQATASARVYALTGNADVTLYRNRITSYSITNRNNTVVSDSPKKWNVLGYNNTTQSWVVLDSRDSQVWTPNQTKIFYFNIGDVGYSKFKIAFLETRGSGFVSIGQIRFFNEFLENPDFIPNTNSAPTTNNITVNGVRFTASSNYSGDYLLKEAFNKTNVDGLDCWVSGSGKYTNVNGSFIGNEWIEIDFGTTLDDFQYKQEYRYNQNSIRSVHNKSIINESSFSFTDNLVTIQDSLLINNNSNDTITNLLVEFIDGKGSTLAYVDLPLGANSVLSGNKLSLSQINIPMSAITNSETDFDLASYFTYTSQILSDGKIDTKSRHRVKAFFRNMIDHSVEHTPVSNITVSDNLASAFSADRTQLLTGDFTTVSGVNLISMSGVDDTDDLRVTDLNQEGSIFRSKFKNRSFMWIKKHGYYGVKVDVDTGFDLSSATEYNTTLNGIFVKSIKISDNYWVHTASQNSIQLRVDTNSVFFFTETETSDLLIAIGDTVDDINSFVNRLIALKNTYASAVEHGDVVTKSWTGVLNGETVTLNAESAVYSFNGIDIPTTVLEHNGKTYIQIYNDASNNGDGVLLDRKTGFDINTRLYDSLVKENTMNLILVYQSQSGFNFYNKSVSPTNNLIAILDKIDTGVKSLIDSVDAKKSTNFLNALVPQFPSSPVTDNVRVSSSSVYINGSYLPHYAFDRSESYGWFSNESYVGGNGNQWVEIDFSNREDLYTQPVNQYSIGVGGFPNCLKSWTVEGTLDGTTWVVLDTRVNQTWVSGEIRTYSFENSVAYKKYKVTVTQTNNVVYAGIGELQFYSTVDFNNNFTFNNIILRAVYIEKHNSNINKSSITNIDNFPYSDNGTDIGLYNYSTQFDAYVSPFGSDITGTGTISNPFKTVNHALNSGFSVIGLLPGVYTETKYGSRLSTGYTNTSVHNLFPSDVDYSNRIEFKQSQKIKFTPQLEYFYTTTGIKTGVYVSSVFGKETVVIENDDGQNVRDYPILCNVNNMIIDNVTFYRKNSNKSYGYQSSLFKKTNNCMISNCDLFFSWNWSLFYYTNKCVVHSCIYNKDWTLGYNKVSSSDSVQSTEII